MVAQEIAEAFDTPDDHVFEMVQTRAFTGQPMGRPILGSVASLKPADKTSVEAWRARLYSPDRMVVSVSGAVEEGELLALAERWFGEAVAAPVEAPAPAVFVGGHAKLTRKIEQANLVFQLPALSATDPALSAMRLFGEILGGAWRRACSRARGKSAAWPTPSTPIRSRMRMRGCWASTPGRRRTGPGSWPRSRRPRCGRWPTPDRPKGTVAGQGGDEGGPVDVGRNPMSRAGRNAAQTLIFGAPRASALMTEQLESQTIEDVRTVGGRVLAGGKAASAVLGPRSAAPAGEASPGRCSGADPDARHGHETCRDSGRSGLLTNRPPGQARCDGGRVREHPITVSVMLALQSTRPGEPMSVRVALIVGSLRKGAYSRAIGLELKTLAAPGLELDLVEIGDLPLYNPDLDTETPPPAWTRFRDEVATTEAVLFVTPEYNRSIPGALKNALDVGSRPYGHSVGQEARRHRQRVARRPGRLRRQPPPAPALVFLGMPTMQQPEAYIGNVADLLDDDGKLKKDDTRKFLKDFADAFALWIEKSKA